MFLFISSNIRLLFFQYLQQTAQLEKIIQEQDDEINLLTSQLSESTARVEELEAKDHLASEKVKQLEAEVAELKSQLSAAAASLNGK